MSIHVNIKVFLHIPFFATTLHSYIHLPNPFIAFFLYTFGDPIDDDLSCKEKTLLTLLGENPDTPTETLIKATGYHHQSTLSKKKRELIKNGYLKGPYYYINVNAVGENELYDVYADIEFDVSDYDFVFSLIKSIGCFRWLYPVIQNDRFLVYFQCNYFTQIAQLLNRLKKEGIIKYTLYSSQYRWITRNPDFFGKEILTYDNLFSDCELPDMHYPPRELKKTWRWLDIRMMAYLQVKSLDLESFRKCEKEFYNLSWKRSQIKYTIKKLIEHKIAEKKHYNVSPYPRDKCFSFVLFVRTKSPLTTLQVMENLGKNSRVYKTYTLAGKTGIILCWANVQNIPLFLSFFDEAEEISLKMHQLKAHDTRYILKDSFSMENFDLENQRWIFPFHEYEENIEQLLEKR